MTTSAQAKPKLDIDKVRHAVYYDLLGYLAWPSEDQVTKFITNLHLYDVNAADESRARQIEAAVVRFGMGGRLRVSPDINEVINPMLHGVATTDEIAVWLAKKWGDLLAYVPGFYRRPPNPGSDKFGPWQLNLPRRCFLYGYTHHHFDRAKVIENGKLRMENSAKFSTLNSQLSTAYYAGILCQPVDALDRYFLLSSSKFGGPKAQPLAARDRMYFEQSMGVER